MIWRLLRTRPLPAADNMALDEALMGRARATGESVLRIYEWERPSLSLGRNQRARGAYDLRRAAEAGITMVRRMTGGRALLHHREVTYSVTSPAAARESIRESYAWINRLLLDGLSRLGVTAGVADGGKRAPIPDATPCFEQPAAGELVVGGRKLVGSAQWRDAGAMLQHGSILVDDDQWLAASLRVQASPAPPGPATLRELLGRAPDAAEVAEAITNALHAQIGSAPTPMHVDDDLSASAAQLRERYLSDEWTWRR